MTPEAALLAHLEMLAPTEHDRWLVSRCSSPVEAMALAIRMSSKPSPCWRSVAAAVALYSQEPTYTIDRGVSVECVCRTDRGNLHLITAPDGSNLRLDDEAIDALTDVLCRYSARPRDVGELITAEC